MSAENEQMQQIRRITQALIFSGSLNIILLALFFYFQIKETPPQPYYELKPVTNQDRQIPLAMDQSNAEIVRNFKRLSFEQLILKLSNSQLVENGYAQRDLALGALIKFYHFDFGRALRGLEQPLQERAIPFGVDKEGQPLQIVLYPGLSDSHFQDIIHFANAERWPVTGEGLFQLLQKQPNEVDLSLADAFYMTPEFLAIETLFKRSDIEVTKSDLLAVITQGDWKMLSNFVERQRQSQDLTPAHRQRLLLDYLANGSKSAAYLILKTDPIFALKKLDDANVLVILNLLNEKTPEAEQFVLAMLTSPRSDRVWQTAATRMYEYVSEPIPEKNLHHAALRRFVTKESLISNTEEPILQKKLKVRNVENEIKVRPERSQPKLLRSRIVPPTPKPITIKNPSKPIKETTQHQHIIPYIVKDGDSLWKIAKHFNVSVEKLKAYNHLQSNALKPGSILKIPAPGKCVYSSSPKL